MTSLDDLQRIDPAGPPDPCAHERPEARRLAHLTMGHPAEVLPQASTSPRRALVLAGAAAAAVVGGLVFIPGLSGGDAYSTWTAVPTPVSNDDRAAAAQTCGEQMDAGRQTSEADDEGRAGPAHGGAEVELAEQRGVFTYVVLHADSVRTTCLIEGDPAEPEALSASVLSIDGYAEPPPEGISAAALSVSNYDGENLVFLSAKSGELVQAAELHVPGAPDVVHASVQDGVLAAWVPAWLSEPGTMTLRLHLADGTSVDLDREQVHAAGRAG